MQYAQLVRGVRNFRSGTNITFDKNRAKTVLMVAPNAVELYYKLLEIALNWFHWNLLLLLCR